MYNNYAYNTKLLLLIAHFCFKYLHYAENQVDMEMSNVFTFPKVINFDGRKFYEEFKGADFLTRENVVTILSNVRKLQNWMRRERSAKIKSVRIYGMFIKPGIPLVIHSSGANELIEGTRFTARRLSGLAAAYVYDNFQLFPELDAPEPEALGLDWDNKFGGNQYEEQLKRFKRKMYLSAVPGAEYFVDQFDHYPLICGLKKFQRGDITEEELLHMAKIRLPSGVRTATQCMSTLYDLSQVESYLPRKRNHNYNDEDMFPAVRAEILSFGCTFSLKEAVESAPDQVKSMFTLEKAVTTKRQRCDKY